MSTDTTLFAHIAPWLTDRIEDVAVEALGYILSNSPATRRALSDTLKEGKMEVGPIDRVETWETGDEGEIPDLVCFDNKGQKQVLIEAKFWADLTKNQPNQYLKQLLEDRPDGPAALLFAAPETRLELLWPELCRLAKKEFKVNIISESGPVRSATIDSDSHQLQLTSWATLLERMKNAACSVDDTVAAADIRQLRGLTDRMDGDAFLPFGSEDLASETAQQMLVVAQLVDDATYHAKRAGWAHTDGLVATPKRTGYGRYIRIGGVDTWFGIHFSGWAKHGDTPLWLSYWKGYHEQLKQAELTTKMTEIDDRFCIPIPLPTANQYNTVLNSVISSLESVAKEFGYAELAPYRIDSDFLRTWRQKDLRPEFAERMLGAAQLVDETAWRVANRAEEDGSRWANTDGLKKIINPRREGYGRFIRIGGVKAWLGIHFGAWAHHCDTPLWLVFDHDAKSQLASLTDTAHEVDWRHCVPIYVPATVEHDEVLETVVNSLKEIAIQLEASNG